MNQNMHYGNNLSPNVGPVGFVALLICLQVICILMVDVQKL
jgi:hypothetical protein